MQYRFSIPLFAALVAIWTAAVFSPPAIAQTSPTVTAQPNQPPTPGITGDWLGERTRLANDGLTVAAAVYYDYSQNFQGGLSTSQNVNRELFDLDITFTTDQMLNWHGGTFFVNFLNHAGTDGSTDLTGDIQGFDNQDGPASTQIYQFYYQQIFVKDQLRFKIGRMDATTDFAYTANGSAFLASTFGYSPAIVNFPTYPDPAPGADLFWTPGDHFYASVGAYDANQSDRAGILAGDPYIVRTASSGEFLITEAGEKWTVGENKLAGRLGVGGYYNTGEFHRFDGTAQYGAPGMYAVFDQTLWQDSSPAGTNSTSPRNLGIFGQYGLADGRISPIDQHIGGGFAWTGPLPMSARAADVLGVGATYVHFSGDWAFTEDYELAIEGFYKFQITPWFNIQPDLQYIIHPGGMGLRDALAPTLRVELDF